MVDFKKWSENKSNSHSHLLRTYYVLSCVKQFSLKPFGNLRPTTCKFENLTSLPRGLLTGKQQSRDSKSLSSVDARASGLFVLPISNGHKFISSKYDAGNNRKIIGLDYVSLFTLERKMLRDQLVFCPILTHPLASRIFSSLDSPILFVSFQKNTSSSRTLTENSQTFHKFQ